MGLRPTIIMTPQCLKCASTSQSTTRARAQNSSKLIQKACQTAIHARCVVTCLGCGQRVSRAVHLVGKGPV